MNLNKNELNMTVEVLNNIIKNFSDYIYYINEYYTYEERKEYKNSLILLKNKYQDMLENEKEIL